MNDFFTKPIDRDEMLRMLIKWIQPSVAQQPEAFTTPAPLASVEAPRHGDDLPEHIPGLDVPLALGYMMGKKALYLAMLQKFVKGQKACVHNLQEALLAQDRVMAQRIAHTLKGVSATLGATGVADHAGAVEHAIRADLPAAELELAISTLEVQLNPLMRDLEAWLAVGVSGAVSNTRIVGKA